MYIEKLKALKAAKNFTLQRLADESGIPQSTVSRILSGQTDNPSFQTIATLVKAMDGSLDDLAGIPRKETGCNAEMYERMLADRDKTIQYRGKWIVALFSLCCLLIVVTTIYIIMDLRDPSQGWIYRDGPAPIIGWVLFAVSVLCILIGLRRVKRNIKKEGE